MISCFIIDDENHTINLLSNHITTTPGLKLLGYKSDWILRAC